MWIIVKDVINPKKEDELKLKEDGGIMDNDQQISSIVLGFLNPTLGQRHWDMTSFCMQ